MQDHDARSAPPARGTLPLVRDQLDLPVALSNTEPSGSREDRWDRGPILSLSGGRRAGGPAGTSGSASAPRRATATVQSRHGYRPPRRSRCASRDGRPWALTASGRRGGTCGPLGCSPAVAGSGWAVLSRACALLADAKAQRPSCLE
jgi:hypothetical protein